MNNEAPDMATFVGVLERKYRTQMKKQLLLITLLAAFTSTSMAQARFGLKLAPNMSWTKPDSPDLDKSGNVFGYTFGLIMDLGVGVKENYAFSTGILLNNTGGKFSQPFTYTDNGTEKTDQLESRLKLRYLEVPLTMKLKTNEVGYMTYFGLIGVGTAFNLRAKSDQETIDPTTGEKTTKEDVDIGDNTNLFKASLIVGGGIEFNITGDTHLMAGISYNGGFTNTFDGVKDDDGKDVKVLQNYLELNLGVYF